MSINTNINNLLAIKLDSEKTAQSFLNTFSDKEQEQLIDAMYFGRDHINNVKVQEDYLPISRNRLDHIPNDHFARILYEKESSISHYFDKPIDCTRNSDIDLNEI